LDAQLDSYQNRLLLAHFAIVTFALVASFGVWHEALQQHSHSLDAFSLTLTALVLLVLFGQIFRVSRNASAFVAVTSPDFSGDSLRGSRSAFCMTLEHIRRANRLAGAPPATQYRKFQVSDSRVQHNQQCVEPRFFFLLFGF
jgi:hypothetical protein